MRPKTGVRISFEVLVESKQNSSYADSRRVSLYIIAAESVRFERVSQAEISSPISVVLCIGVIVNNDNAHACEEYWFRLLERFASFRLNKSQFASAVFRFCVFRGFRVFGVG